MADCIISGVSDAGDPVFTINEEATYFVMYSRRKDPCVTVHVARLLKSRGLCNGFDMHMDTPKDSIRILIQAYHTGYKRGQIEGRNGLRKALDDLLVPEREVK